MSRDKEKLDDSTSEWRESGETQNIDATNEDEVNQEDEADQEEEVRQPDEILDALRQKEHIKKKVKRLVRNLVLIAAVIYIALGVIWSAAFVRGDSMNPTFEKGDFIFVYRLNKVYKKGDVVLFYSDMKNEHFIKRIVAVEGDTVEIDDETGSLVVNGEKVKEVRTQGKTYSAKGGTTYPCKIQKGYVFVLGDNREMSMDSRHIGVVNISTLTGKVIFHK